jgi:WD40 repeat protein
VEAHFHLRVAMPDQPNSYDAFISYSHARDLRLAEALQHDLERFARPWYKARILQIFRDQTSLSAAPGLWSAVESSLGRSKWFVLMASPDSARSIWVQREIEWWKSHRTADRILIALTDGSIRWAGNDFAWDETDAVPKSLAGVFNEEPLWIDLRKLRPTAASPSSHSERPRLGDIVAEFAAPIMGRDKDTLIGEHVNQQRRIRYLTRTVVAALSILLVMASLAATVAFQQKFEADRQRQDAITQAHIATSRLLLSQADIARERDPRSALLLGIAARKLSNDGETTAGLARTLTSTRYAGSVTGHSDSVNSIAFSPNSRTLATASTDGTVTLWNVVRHGKPVQLSSPWADRPPLRFVLFAGDHSLIAGDVEGSVIFDDITDPKKPTQVGQLRTGHTDSVTAAALSPDRRTLVTGSADKTIRLWNVTNPANPSLIGRPVAVSQGYVVSIAFTPDGRTLATGNTGGTVALYDLTDPSHPVRLGNPFQVGKLSTASSVDASSVAFAQDGHTLATGGLSGITQLWDITHRASPTKLGRPLAGHSADVRSLDFAPDGRSVAIGGDDNTVTLWDVTDRGRALPVGSPLVGHTNGVTQVVFAPDGQTVASASIDGTVMFWDVSGHGAVKPLASLPDPPEALGMALAPDRHTLAVGNGDGTVSFWNIANPAASIHLCDVKAHDDAVLSVVFSPNRNLMATGGSDGKIFLWNIADPACPTPLGGPIIAPDPPDQGSSLGFVWSLGFAGDAHTLAAGIADGTVLLWDVVDPGQPQRLGQPLKVEDLGTWSIAFAPDGGTLAVGHSDGKVSLWDVRDRLKPLMLGRPMIGHQGWGAVHSVAFTSDGTVLVAGGDDGSVISWDVTNTKSPSRLGQPLTGQGHAILSVAFSPDSRLMAAGDQNGKLLLWDTDDRSHPLRLGEPLTTSGREIWSVAFSSDGKTLATSSEYSIDLLDISSLHTLVSNPAQQACEITGRGLNEAEWKQYTAGIPFQDTCPT